MAAENLIHLMVQSSNGKKIPVTAPSTVNLSTLLKKAGEALGEDIVKKFGNPGVRLIIEIKRIDVTLEQAGVTDGCVIQVIQDEVNEMEAIQLGEIDPGPPAPNP